MRKTAFLALLGAALSCSACNYVKESSPDGYTRTVVMPPWKDLDMSVEGRDFVLESNGNNAAAVANNVLKGLLAAAKGGAVEPAVP